MNQNPEYCGKRQPLPARRFCAATLVLTSLSVLVGTGCQSGKFNLPRPEFKLPELAFLKRKGNERINDHPDNQLMPPSQLANPDTPKSRRDSGQLASNNSLPEFSTPPSTPSEQDASPRQPYSLPDVPNSGSLAGSSNLDNFNSPAGNGSPLTESPTISGPSIAGQPRDLENPYYTPNSNDFDPEEKMGNNPNFATVEPDAGGSFQPGSENSTTENFQLSNPAPRQDSIASNRDSGSPFQLSQPEELTPQGNYPDTGYGSYQQPVRPGSQVLAESNSAPPTNEKFPQTLGGDLQSGSRQTTPLVPDANRQFGQSTPNTNGFQSAPSTLPGNQGDSQMMSHDQDDGDLSPRTARIPVDWLQAESDYAPGSVRRPAPPLSPAQSPAFNDTQRLGPGVLPGSTSPAGPAVNPSQPPSSTGQFSPNPFPPSQSPKGGSFNASPQPGMAPQSLTPVAPSFGSQSTSPSSAAGSGSFSSGPTPDLPSQLPPSSSPSAPQIQLPEPQPGGGAFVPGR